MRERHINSPDLICPADRLQWRGMKQMMLPFRKPGPATVIGYVAASGKVDGVGKGFVPVGWPVFDGRLRIRGISAVDAMDLLDRIGSLDGGAALPPACGVVQCCSSIAGPEHARRVGHAGLKPRR